MDFAGTRERLREQLEQAEIELADVRDLLGELALDVQLGNAPQSELEKARATQAKLTARVAELQAAREKVDEREADHAAAVAEKQRQADEKRLAELQGICNAAGAKAVDLAVKLADTLAEGRSASEEAGCARPQARRQHSRDRPLDVGGEPRDQRTTAQSLVLVWLRRVHPPGRTRGRRAGPDRAAVMAAAENDPTVMLARTRAQAADCLSAYEAALGRAKDESEAAQAKATIQPLREAIVFLAQAVSASVGYVVARKREAAEPALTGGPKAQGA